MRRELSAASTSTAPRSSVEASFGVASSPTTRSASRGCCSTPTRRCTGARTGPTASSSTQGPPTRRGAGVDALVMQRELRHALDLRRVRAALPAQARHAHRPDQRGRGPGPLAAPGARAAAARAVPAGRRAHRADRAVDRVGGAPRRSRPRRLDRRRLRLARVGQRLGPQPLLARASPTRDRASWRARVPAATGSASRSPRPRWPSTTRWRPASSPRSRPTASRCRSTTSGSATPRSRSCATSAMSEIKIDRLFITGLDDNEQDRAIVGSVIDLAHSLGAPSRRRGSRPRRSRPGCATPAATTPRASSGRGRDRGPTSPPRPPTTSRTSRTIERPPS